MGFEKASRSDHAVGVWDVSALSTKSANGSGNLSPEDVRPIIELGINETASSLAWILPKSILVGMNNKHIKLFDLRGKKKYALKEMRQVVYFFLPFFRGL